jgi:hypothetical protein
MVRKPISLAVTLGEQRSRGYVFLSPVYNKTYPEENIVTHVARVAEL